MAFSGTGIHKCVDLHSPGFLETLECAQRKPGEHVGNSRGMQNFTFTLFVFIPAGPKKYVDVRHINR